MKNEAKSDSSGQGWVFPADGAKVSVIIPHFNAFSTLARALDSAYAQTLQPYEVIVVDDASSLFQRNKVKLLIQDYPRARLVELPTNQGPATARNHGWDAAIGDWVAFLDSDDAWHPRKLEVQMRAASSTNMKPTVIACKTIYAKDPSELDLSEIPREIPYKILHINDLLLRNQMSTPSVMIKNDVRLRFRAGRRYSEDFELWISLVGLGYTAMVVDLPLAAIFKAPYGDAGLSSHILRMIGGEYKAFTGATRKGALSFAQLLCGLAISTGKSAFRLCKILVYRSSGRSK